jgi:hypothetical protein
MTRSDCRENEQFKAPKGAFFIECRPSIYLNTFESGLK